MAASASDIRSILSLPSPQAGPSQKRLLLPNTASGQKKPDGISRELYSLIGDATPPLTPQYAKPKLKQKPNFGGANTNSRWEWKPFSNAARTDGLKLCHWVKVGIDNEAEYPFAKFNTTTPSYTYSLDEYTRFLEDPEWSKEETDYLFNLAEEYEMRWYVIHDRYEYPESPPRGIDDLKARYYGVCKKLIKSRPWAGDEASKNQLLNIYSFDKEREISRKIYVESLLLRTSEQIAEEESLFIEIKRLEQTERRFAKDRDHLLKTLLGVESGLPLRMDDEGPIAAQLVLDKKKGKRKVDGIEIEPSLASASVTSSTPSLRKSTLIKSNAHDIQHCIQRFEVPPNTSNKSGNTPVYIRSTKTPTPKVTLTAKVHGVLDEMGIGYTRLVFPTQNNLAQLKGVFEACEALVETKRAVDRVEQEIRVLKVRLGRRRGESQDGMDLDGVSETRAVSESQMSPMQRIEGDEESKVEQDQEGAQSLGDLEGQALEDDEMQGEDEEVELGHQEVEMEDVQDDDGGLQEEEDTGDGVVVEYEEDEGDNITEVEDEEVNLMAEGEGEGDDDERVEGEEDDADWEENVSEVQSTRGARKRALSNSSMETSGTTMDRRSSKRHRSRN